MMTVLLLGTVRLADVSVFHRNALQTVRVGPEYGTSGFARVFTSKRAVMAALFLTKAQECANAMFNRAQAVNTSIKAVALANALLELVM